MSKILGISAVLMGLVFTAPLARAEDSAEGSVGAEKIPQYLVVNDSVVRGGRPEAGDLASLAAQGIKTVINLENNSEAVAADREEAQRAGLKFISQPMSGFFSPSNARVEAVLAELQDPSLYPIFIHCRHGEDRTGLILGLYRMRHDHWSAREAYSEMLKLGFHRSLFFLDHYFREKSGL